VLVLRSICETGQERGRKKKKKKKILERTPDHRIEKWSCDWNIFPFVLWVSGVLRCFRNKKEEKEKKKLKTDLLGAE
jgi:hypothetical protein